MRSTSHNGRSGRNGVYSAKHNDRNFDLTHADHIDQDLSAGNRYWHRYQSEEPDMTFLDCERRFYGETFSKSLSARNERYRANGHRERMKTMDDYREHRLSCPEETILQIGKLGDTVDVKLLREICVKHINWQIQTFPNVEILDVALHVDEQGAPHIHVRKVWTAHSKDGLIVGQAKALEEMGIQRPHPDKPKDRYNNPKVTYTAMCRDHLIETCREYGLYVSRTPDKASKRGLELEEYKRSQEQVKAEQALEEAQKALNTVAEAQMRAQAMVDNLKVIQGEYDSKLAFLRKAEEIADLSMMYPPEAKVTEKGVINKQRYVTVPAEMWEAKHVSANEVSYVREAERILDQRLYEWKQTASADNIADLRKQVQTLERNNQSLQRENDLMLRGLEKANKAQDRILDEVEQVLDRLGIADRFYTEWERMKQHEKVKARNHGLSR